MGVHCPRNMLRGRPSLSPIGSATPLGSINDLDNAFASLSGKRLLGQDSNKAKMNKAMTSLSQYSDNCAVKAKP